MYGAQHTYILDDRDVDEYYKNPKFKEFVHLKQTTQKIIVYSTVETIVFIDRVILWTDNSWTPDLHYRWQALVTPERSPLSLEETALIGYHQGIFLHQKRV